MAKPIYKKVPKLFVPLASSLVGTVTFGLICFWLIGQGSAQVWGEVIAADLKSTSLWIVLLYMAVVATMVGWTAYIKAQDLIEISEAGLFTYLQPLVYIPLSYFLVGDQITTTHVLALVLVTVGVVISERRTKKKNSSHRAAKRAY